MNISEHLDTCLKELPIWIRKSGVMHLSDIISDADREEIQKAHAKDKDGWWALYHHGWGTSIRNYLRDAVCPDDQLPSGNWDDYYIQLVEIAVGVRE